MITKCKCGKITTPENTTNSELKRKTPRCRACTKIREQLKKERDYTEEQKQRKLRILAKPLINTVLKTREINVPDNSIVTYIHQKHIERTTYTLPLAIQSPMGTGKTQAVKDVCNQYPFETIVYVTPNLTTIEATSKELTKAGIKWKRYDRDTILEKGVVHLVTPDSYHILFGKPDVLIVDEAYTIYTEMIQKTDSSYNNNAGRNKTRLENYLKNYEAIRSHPKTLILDAFIPQGLLDIFGIDDMIINTFRKNKEISFFEPLDKKNSYLAPRFRTRIINYITNTRKANTKVLVQSTSKTFLRVIKDTLDLKGIESILFTDDDNRGLSIEEINKHQIILASPKIKVGVSLTADKVFLYNDGSVVPPYSFFQMIDRARDSKSIEIAVARSREIKEQSSVLSLIEIYDPRHPLIKFNKIQKNLRVNNIEYIKGLIQSNYKILSKSDVSSTVYNTITTFIGNNGLDVNLDLLVSQLNTICDNPKERILLHYIKYHPDTLLEYQETQ